MKAIILAGGFGTRLRSVTGDIIPKCLVPIMDKPIIDYVISRMQKQGIKDITLALHYKADMFLKKYQHLRCVVEEIPLGTGGAIKNCIEGDDPVLVVNGDTIAPIDYTDMLANHAGPLSVAITSKNGHMQSAGIYIIDPKLFDNSPKGSFSFENDIVPHTLKKFYPIPWFTDMGSPEGYEEVKRTVE